MSRMIIFNHHHPDRGCLEWGGEQVATEFLLSTEGWSEFFLNDAPLSRRPWLHRPDFDVIDKILSHSDIADHVCQQSTLSNFFVHARKTNSELN